MRVIPTLVVALLAALLLGPVVPASRSRARSRRASAGLVVEAGTARSGEDAPIGVLSPTRAASRCRVRGARRAPGRGVAAAGLPRHGRRREGRDRAADGPVRDDNVVRASYAGDATTPPTVTADAEVELVRRRRGCR